jgi:aryl-alcohol dehydrogenase-like predicted oxidoreductase
LLRGFSLVLRTRAIVAMKPPESHRITSLTGESATPLGLAGHPEQDARCIARAAEQGINYFFFYGPEPGEFGKALVPLLRKRRDEVIVASGSGSRKRGTLLSARRKILSGLGIETLDIFFAEYIHPGDDNESIFGPGGVLDELAAWKAEGVVRYVGATAHERKLSRKLAADPRVDVLMHRFNMAHRKAATEVFPEAMRAKTPIVAFTATRWQTLFNAPAGWTDSPPSATDCYRYCLAEPAVQVVLTSPRTVKQLEENLAVLAAPPLSRREMSHWERFGDLIHGAGADSFETKWQ